MCKDVFMKDHTVVYTTFSLFGPDEIYLNPKFHYVEAELLMQMAYSIINLKIYIF